MQDIGKVRITLDPNGQWNGSYQYDTLVMTLYNGNGYISKRANTGKQPDLNTDDWEKVVSKGDTGAAAGFGTPTATIDANVGTPSVEVTASGTDIAKVFAFAFHNLKGQKGDTGDAAGFGSVTATVDSNVGTPSVDVEASGPATAKRFAFAFHNMKGETGVSITNIAKTSTSGLVDTYTITFSDNTTKTFTVTNGNGIVSVAKTSTSGLVDTYTVTFQNGTTTTFTVTNGAAAGFGTPSASVDANVGTPSVEVTATGPETAKIFTFAFHNLKGEIGEKGETGNTGAAAGFSTPTASVDANVGTPSVTVTASGPDTAKVFDFAFHNLKGQKGDKGDTGETDIQKATMPTASASELGHIYQYIGTTTSTLKNGRFYRCVANGGVYSWEEVHDDTKADKSALENGTLIPALADDLNIPNTASLIHRQSAYIETAGGSDSIKSGSARVLSVKGTQSGISSANAKIVARGFNQLGSSMIAGQVATIPCVASEWGAYGSSAKNNGYLFTDNAGNIVVPTSVTQNGVAVPTQTYGGVVYYLPSNNGTMIATFAAGVTMANICCHICWSNYRDRDYAAYAESVIDIASLISTMGGTLRRIDMGSLFTFDEIVMSNVASERKYYKRVDVATLSALTWAMTSTESEGSTIYHFTAPISAMLENGIYQIVGSGVSGIYVEGNTVKVDSTTITSVADLQTALGSMSIKYQKATVTSGTHNLTGAITVDDFGTIMLAGGSTSADMDIEFITYWRDTLKNLPSRIDTNELVIADVLNDLNARLSAIEDKLSNGIDHLKVDNLDVVKTLRGSMIADSDSDYAFVICRAKAPDIAPKFIGQRWVNTTNGMKYTAKGVSASTDFVQD